MATVLPNEAQVRAHLRRMREATLRKAHAQANNPAMLARAAREEHRTIEDAEALRDLINQEFARRGFA